MKRTLTLVLSLACVCVPFLELSTQAINSLVIAQTTDSKNKSDKEINNIAKKITVQIFQAASQPEENLIGTGFIVKKQNQKDKNSEYQVLTNAHVVKKLQSGYHYQIKTYDNRIYKAFLAKNTNKFNNYDLAILLFNSSVGYETAKLGKSDKLQAQQKVFVAGFPCESTPCQSKLVIKSGVIAPLEFLLQGKTLLQGYKIGYDIDVQPGTSGGPIIDTLGEVVGVNGKSKSIESPFANSPDPYRFTDNTQPDKDIKLVMRYFAWGIPIETYINLYSNTNSPIENTPQYSLSGNRQNNPDSNLESQGIVSKNSLIENLIIISILALMIMIAWYLFKHWNKYKNQPRFQAIEDKQKELESDIFSHKEEIKDQLQAIDDVISSQQKDLNSQQLKVIGQEQKLSKLEGKLQRVIKVLIEEKKHQREKLQDTSSTED